MPRRMPFVLKNCIGAAIVIGAVIFFVAEDHRSTEKYQRECRENIRTIASASEEKETSPDKCKEAKDYMPWWYVLVAWPEGISVWVVIATGYVIGWQSYETRKAAKATEESVLGSKDTAVKQLRAYVGVKGARLYLRDDGTVDARVEVFNSGQTPAFAFEGAFWGRFTKYPIPPVVPFDKKSRVSTGIIGAGLSYHLLGNGIDSHAGDPTSVLIHLDDPEVCFCINGDYTYRDVFKEVRQLRFQMIIGGPSGIRTGSDEDGTFAIFCNDSEGNDVD